MISNREKNYSDVHAVDSVKNIVSSPVEFVLGLISNKFSLEFVGCCGFLDLFGGWSVYDEFTAEQIQGALM
jgi:hypothetical protein